MNVGWEVVGGSHRRLVRGPVRSHRLRRPSRGPGWWRSPVRVRWRGSVCDSRRHPVTGRGPRGYDRPRLRSLSLEPSGPLVDRRGLGLLLTGSSSEKRSDPVEERFGFGAPVFGLEIGDRIRVRVTFRIGRNETGSRRRKNQKGQKQSSRTQPHFCFRPKQTKTSSSIKVRFFSVFGQMFSKIVRSTRCVIDAKLTQFFF